MLFTKENETTKQTTCKHKGRPLGCPKLYHITSKSSVIIDNERVQLIPDIPTAIRLVDSLLIYIARVCKNRPDLCCDLVIGISKTSVRGFDTHEALPHIHLLGLCHSVIARLIREYLNNFFGLSVPCSDEQSIKDLEHLHNVKTYIHKQACPTAVGAGNGAIRRISANTRANINPRIVSIAPADWTFDPFPLTLDTILLADNEAAEISTEIEEKKADKCGGDCNCCPLNCLENSNIYSRKHIEPLLLVEDLLNDPDVPVAVANCYRIWRNDPDPANVWAAAELVFEYLGGYGDYWRPYSYKPTNGGLIDMQADGHGLHVNDVDGLNDEAYSAFFGLVAV